MSVSSPIRTIPADDLLTPDPEFPDVTEWYTSMVHHMAKAEHEAQLLGRSFSLIDPVPMWLCALDFDYLPSPSKPARRRFRFALLGGGQLVLNERFVEWGSPVPKYMPPTYCSHRDIVVIPHTPDGVRRYRGEIYHGVFETSQDAVLLAGPQVIADRAAMTLRLIDHDPENFCALLDARTRCAICNRPLGDEVSKLVAVGPDCARKHRIPHTLAAASARLKRREALFSSTLSGLSP